MQDARYLAKKKLPSMIFDYVDGVALEADGYYSNAEYFKAIKLSQNVLAGGGAKKYPKVYSANHTIYLLELRQWVCVILLAQKQIMQLGN